MAIPTLLSILPSAPAKLVDVVVVAVVVDVLLVVCSVYCNYGTSSAENDATSTTVSLPLHNDCDQEHF